ncbi:SusC/RagA family TonB-linked outer membrane protein [Niabella sp.]|uniref:SusC/RagA family TonB-linked outer membrane protein n=1 Tax=Niabella sp. TaxID=1962976 RepID=UPI002639F5AA|nr:SusC/RagA family TonB-linked outer membrane protein [Niabella sp.]
MRIWVLTISVFILLQVSAQAQHVVKGSVQDKSTGAAVPGATISRGSRSVQSDSAGYFSIEAAAGTKLQVSHVNYSATSYTVTNDTALVVIEMGADDSKNSMNTVVVVGFQKKNRLVSTAATTVISAEDIKDVPASSVVDLLQGKVAGVNIQNTSGAPGAKSSIFQRGLSSITVTGEGNDAYLATAQPLIIIDGVPVDPNTDNEYGFAQAGPGISPLALLPAEDVESIEILKDAAATSAYGSRGAYGVWIITTKRGRSKRPQISYIGNLFLSDVPTLRPIYGGRMERALKIMQVVENNLYSRQYGMVQVNTNYLLSDSLNPYLNNSTNWQSLFYRPTYNHSHNLAFSGGDPNFNYKVNVSYYEENGIIKNTGLKRYSAGMNTVYQTKDSKFRMMAAITATNATNKKGSGVGLLQTGVATSGMASTLLPPPDVYTENSDALAAFQIDDDNKTNSMLTSLIMELQLAKGLRFKTEGNFNFQTATSNTFYPSWLNSGSQYGVSTGSVAQSQYNTYSRNSNGYQNRNALSYLKSFGENTHNLSAFVFSEITGNLVNTNYSLLYGAPNNQISGPVGFNLARSIYGTLGAPINGKTFAYGGTVSYNYLQKYVVDFNFRQDGSSTTGPLAGYRQNPAIAFRWNFFKERFMSKASWLDYGAIRGSWGKTVSPQGDIFTAYGRYYPSGTYMGQPSVLMDYGTAANPLFLPVSTIQYDLGFEAGLFRNRVTIDYDYYYRIVGDQVYYVDLPRETGYSRMPGNNVSIVNYGHELTLSFRPLAINSKANWRLQINGAFNRSILTRLPENMRQIVYNPNDLLGLPVLYRLGRNPLGNLLYNTKGVYATNADVPYDPLTGKRMQINGQYLTAGDPIFADLNGDYKIDANDRVAVGDPQPKLTGGIINTVTYKNFGLTLSTSFTFFRDVLNTPLARTFQYFYSPDNTNISTAQVLPPISQYNYWKQPGDIATYPNPLDYQQNRLIDAFRYNQTLFMEDGSYFKFNYVTFSYTLDKNWVNRFLISNARIYFTGKNLLVLSHYSGPNPENVSDLGRDNPNGYPNPRQYSLGVNVTF